MGGLTRSGVIMLMALAATSAQAQVVSRISLAMRGDRQSILANQLAEELCDTHECVLRAKVFTGSRVDFAKVRRQKVAGVLSGTVKKQGVVTFAWYTRSHRPVKTWTFPLSRERNLGADSLDNLSQDIDRLLGVRRASPAPAVAATPPPAETAPPQPPPVPPTPVAEPIAEPATPPSPTPPQPTPTAAPATATAPPTEEKKTKTPAEPQQESGEKMQTWFVAAEVGVHATKRNLSYQGVNTTSPVLPQLQPLDGAYGYSPYVHLEVYPISLVANGVMGGLGVFAEYGTSAGLKTEIGGWKENTLYKRAEVGLVWRVRPILNTHIVIAPTVSYRALQFQIDRSYQSIPGLPDADMVGWRGGLNLELPLGSITLLLNGGVVKWTRAKGLIDQTDFFPAGNAYALEAEGGLSFPFIGPISLRLLGEYSITKYALDPDGSPPRATGATDRYVGGRAAFHLQF